ncbi:MAG: roadblock/LC7 domain-containing protein [Methanomicrobiales archaeon]|nr:roadblock/LC7 domain-containing protein [Methanomicrobiales archaeon]
MTKKQLSKEHIQGFVREIMALGGVDACALVSRDGIIMEKCIEQQNVHAPTFAAMSATMLASTEAAAGTIHIEPPKCVTAEGKTATILVMGAGSGALITTLLNISADITSVKEQLAEIARRIGEEV